MAGPVLNCFFITVCLSVLCFYTCLCAQQHHLMHACPHVHTYNKTNRCFSTRQVTEALLRKDYHDNLPHQIPAHAKAQEMLRKYYRCVGCKVF